MNLLAFDYGASSGRSILGTFDGDTITTSELHRFENRPVTYGSHLYWDFPFLFDQIKIGLLEAKKNGTAPAAIGVNTWGVDFGLLDRAGLLMGNPFHYRDSLTDGAMDEFFGVLPSRELYAKTGIQNLKFNTLFQLYAIGRRYPHLLEQARSLLFMPDLMNYYLTGVPYCEYTIASTSQMLDVRQRDWNASLLGLLGLPDSLLQPVSPACKTLGGLTPALRDELDIDTSVVSVCGHDTASAVLAVPMKVGEICAWLSCGTWSLLGVELDAPLTHSAAYDSQYSNEGGRGGSIRFLKNIMGLWIAGELKRQYDRANGPTGFAVLDAAEDAAPPLRSLINPDSPEFLAPGHMIEKVRDFCRRSSQPVPESIGELLRCVTESLALKYRMYVESLEDVLGYKLPVLRIVGGGIKNKALMKATASALGRPVCAGPVEATSLGNLCGQLLALGELSSMAQARSLIARSCESQNYAPSDGELWQDAYGRFQKICAL